MREFRPIFWLAALLLLAPSEASRAQDKIKIGFFGFELINTSAEPTSDAERRRIARLGEILIEMLEESGRYEVVPLSPELQAKIAANANITGCNGCELDYAREAGVDVAAFGVVQKVSNLILNENLYMRRADGAPYYARSVDIRGNTDQSWERGMRYLLRNYFLKER
jgi:hypothetical protein